MAKPIPRIRKHKARQRAAQPTSRALGEAAVPDSNVAEILPESRDAREQRRTALREELRAGAPESKASSKKRKRLDKYIDTKLRKEETLDLLKKLANQKVDTSLLRSSKTLGRGREDTKQRLGRVLRETRAGIAAEEETQLLYEARELRLEDADARSRAVATKGDASVQPLPLTASTSSKIPGSGLKRPLELDQHGIPIIPKRKRMKIAKKPALSTGEEPHDSEWDGFSSEDEAVTGIRDLGEGSTASQTLGENDTDESDAEESEDTDAPEDDDDHQDDTKPRVSAFTAWATAQRNQALGFVPKNTLDSSTQQTHKNQVAIRPGVLMNVASAARNVFNVAVTRTPEIEGARSALPVVAEEQKIMEAIRNNDCMFLCGATGSGKTTQVPQFLFEAGYGNREGPNAGLIGITQPRRVAAVSMAKRVALELGSHKDKVAHQIRFDSTVGGATAIKFMTDGVLLRELSQDFTLAKYSAIVIDEAHERSVNTDILIGMLSRVIETRAKLAQQDPKQYKPLKLIIMSATLRTGEFIENKALFRGKIPPVVQVEGRQYPVTIHFARTTRANYVEDVFQKIRSGHKKLPNGAMLVFLTGQDEISQLERRLKESLPSTESVLAMHSSTQAISREAMIEDEDIDAQEPWVRRQSVSASHKDKDGDMDDDFQIYGADNDEDEEEFEIGDEPRVALKIHVLPLYSQLPNELQMRVFEAPPENSRLIVLATNVAETSLTIPGVRFVFDCGRAKSKRFDTETGVQSFTVDWISKASAKQRTGRAGRTGPGHCYRLYSSAVYERDFEEFTAPEISRTPIEGVVLQLKSMGIPKMSNFPFPTPPDRYALEKAERLLEYLGAIFHGKVTGIGRDLAVYPLSPRLSKMLVIAKKSGLIEQAITMVAALAVSNLCIPESQLQLFAPPVMDETAEWTEEDNREAREREQRRKDYNKFHGNLSRLDRRSDATKMITTLLDFNAATPHDLTSFYHYTRVKAIKEALDLVAQLRKIVHAHDPGPISARVSTTVPSLPTTAQARQLRTIVAAGYIDKIAIRADLSPTPPESSRKPRRPIDVPYITLFPSSVERHSRTRDAKSAERDKFVYIHPSSLLSQIGVEKMPQFLVYSHLSRADASQIIDGEKTSPKTRIHPLTPVSVTDIISMTMGTSLLEESKPLGRIDGLTRDPATDHERRAITTIPFLRNPQAVGESGWPLPPALHVVQQRIPVVGWVNESALSS